MEVQPQQELTINITGGTFRTIRGDYNVIRSPDDLGILALSQAISSGAMHDSAERSPPSNFHNDAIEEAYDLVSTWMKDLSPNARRILWAHGSSRSEREAISQTLAQVYHSSGQLAGSFFFKKSTQGRKNFASLFSTIAYQAAIYVSGLREPISQAMSLNPILPTKSIETQLEFLLVEPFRNPSHPLPEEPLLVIIDGLDRCESKTAQTEILELIANAISNSGLPLRFLITSRADSHIRKTFLEESLLQISSPMVLTSPLHRRMAHLRRIFCTFIAVSLLSVISSFAINLQNLFYFTIQRVSIFVATLFASNISRPAENNVTDESSPSRRSIPRAKFHTEYIPLLELYFEINAYPDMADRLVLAQTTHMSQRQIEVWFQNHRNRAKREGRILKRLSIPVPPQPRSTSQSFISNVSFVSDIEFTVSNPAPYVYPAPYNSQTSSDITKHGDLRLSPHFWRRYPAKTPVAQPVFNPLELHILLSDKLTLGARKYGVVRSGVTGTKSLK